MFDLEAGLRASLARRKKRMHAKQQVLRKLDLQLRRELTSPLEGCRPTELEASAIGGKFIWR